MTSAWRTLRRRILTPDMSATNLDVRGFKAKNPAAREMLETVGRTFLTGYSYAAETPSPDPLSRRLDVTPTRFRGFAYEGAAMALAVLDALPGPRRHVARFLAGPGDAHIYMAYVGVGWAMARLPRFRWWTLTAPDPLVRWLVLDGLGFHQAYFATDRYVYGQYREAAFPWPPGDAHRGYADHAIDQGIGRALWFVCGTDAERVAETIEGFAPGRRADLYSGAGLAATYAGGADEEELRAFRRRAGAYHTHVSQGSVFAASARVRAGLVVPHNEVATRALCGMTVVEAADLAERRRPRGDTPGGPPGYEVWRRAVADEFVVIGRN
ncbi:DUF1702 family protein [Micromonospora sp. WMMA1363]|uniref:DUF1702 family protein n=1 Tax=Micromonospora sp. WMMA1363 TaxID=3053985 RepID=UPI00259CFA94|nr:DUF1702 family protein [Micromonospora sp. WMMA1363]MDM4719256.1 DUF1702 family protein [Micromonospora sp. WMMA1363]